MSNGNHDSAVAIGMDHVAIADGHPEYGDITAECDGLRIRVRCSHTCREKLKSGGPLIKVAHRTIRDQSHRTQTDMNRRLHFSPECAASGIVAVEVLDDDER